MWQFFLASWRSGFRSRALLACIAIGLALVAVAYLSASFSMRQVRTVALDVGLSGLRICLVLVSITLVQDLVGKEIERRGLVFVLSYPVSRGAYIAGRFLGVIALSAVAGIILSLLLWLSVMAVGGLNEQEFGVFLGLPYWTAILGIWLDAVVVTAFTLLVCTVSTVSVMPLVTGLAFAVAGKAFGPLVDYMTKGANGQSELVEAYRPLLAVVTWLLPDLSRLDWRAWPMYGLAPDWSVLCLAIVMATMYIAAMLLIATMLFARREFT